MADIDNQAALKDFFASASPEADPNKAALKTFFVSSQGEIQSPEQALAAAQRPTTIELNALKAGTGGLLGPWAPTWAKPEPVPGGPLTAEEKWKAGMLSAMPAVAGSALMGAGLAPAGLRAAAALTEAGSATASSAGSEAAQEYAPAIPFLPEAMALGIGTGAAKTSAWLKEQKAIREGTSAATQTAAQEAASTAALQQAKDQQLVIQRLHEDPLNSPLVRATAAAESQEVVAKAQAAHAAQTLQSAAETSIQDAAKMTNSNVVTAEDFGKKAQDIARNWLVKIKPARLQAASDELLSGLPKGTSAADIEAPITNTAGTLQSINTSSGALEDLAQIIKPKLGSQLWKTFESKFESPAATKAIEGLEGDAGAAALPGVPSRPVTLADQMQFRTVLGDAMSDSRISSDVGKENIKKLYSSISDDIRDALLKNGVKPEAFEKYNQISSNTFKTAENEISDIISTPNKSLETIYPEKIARKVDSENGGTWLKNLREDGPELGEIADHYASHILREKVASQEAQLAAPGLGPQQPGPAAAVQGARAGSAEAWHKLSPEAKEAMIPDPSLRAELEKAVVARSSAPELQKEMEAKAAEAKAQAVAAVAKQKAIDLYQAKLAVDSATPAPAAPGKVPEAKGLLGSAAEAAGNWLSSPTTAKALLAGGGGLLGLTQQLGISPEMGKMLASGAMVAPYAIDTVKKGAGAVVKNPLSVRFPAEALAGAESQKQNQLVK